LYLHKPESACIYLCLLGYCWPSCSVVLHWRCCFYGRLLSELPVTRTSFCAAVLCCFCLIFYNNYSTLHWFVYVTVHLLTCYVNHCCTVLFLRCYGSRWNSETLQSMDVFHVSLCRVCLLPGCACGYMLQVLGSHLWGSFGTIISSIM